MTEEQDRLTLADVRQRSRQLWIVTAVVQVVALVLGGLAFLQTRDGAYVVVALSVLPLGAVAFALLTMYHFTVIQAQKQG